MEAAVRPAELHLELRQRPRPVRKPQLPRVAAGGGGHAVHGQRPLPALDGPVGAVGRAARCDEPVQVGPHGLAGVRERLPHGPAERAPAARVVEAERHLPPPGLRRRRVRRSPGEHAVLLAPGAIGEERDAVSVHLEPNVGRVARDELGSPRRARRACGSHSYCNREFRRTHCFRVRRHASGSASPVWAAAQVTVTRRWTGDVDMP